MQGRNGEDASKSICVEAIRVYSFSTSFKTLSLLCFFCSKVYPLIVLYHISLASQLQRISNAGPSQEVLLHGFPRRRICNISFPRRRPDPRVEKYPDFARATRFNCSRLQTLLNQTIIPCTMFCSFLAIGTKFKTHQLLGSLTILLLAFLPTINTSTCVSSNHCHSGAGCIFVGACAAAYSMVIRDSIGNIYVYMFCYGVESC